MWILFGLGIGILCLVYLPPVDPWADQLLLMHMLQHLLITALGVPLFLFGSPFIEILRGLPVGVRSRLVSAVRTLQRISFFRKIAHPIVAVLLYEGVFWFWHIPKFYNIALLNDGIHLHEHACMAMAAINLWRVLIDPRPSKSTLSLPLRILMLGLLTTVDMALSAGLTYSSRAWYAYDQLPVPEEWAWNRLQDQQLGGLIMWVPGSLVWIFAMICIFVFWTLKEQDQHFVQGKLGVGRQTIVV